MPLDTSVSNIASLNGLTTEYDDGETPIRERILRQIVARLEAVAAGTDGFSVTWNNVSRLPQDKPDVQFGGVLSVIEGRENKKSLTGRIQAELELRVEFWYRVKKGDDAPAELLRIHRDVYRAMKADINNGDNCLSIGMWEIANELDIDDPKDTMVGGILDWVVSYQHAVGDPAKDRA